MFDIVEKRLMAYLALFSDEQVLQQQYYYFYIVDKSIASFEHLLFDFSSDFFYLSTRFICLLSLQQLDPSVSLSPRFRVSHFVIYRML